MDQRPLRILLIEDDEDDCILIRNLLSEAPVGGHELEWVSSYEELQQAIHRSIGHDVYILDYRLGARDGLEILRELQENGCKTPVIFLTGAGSHAIDMEAMRAGAADYLSKDELTARIVERSIRYAVERKRSKEALLASEREFRTLYEQAPLGYQSLDEEARIIDVNAAWLDFFGYSKDEVVGRWLGDFMTEPSRERLPEHFDCFKGLGEVHWAEFEMLRKDGSRALVAIHGSARFDKRGRFIKSQCIMHDITKRKRAEQALRESQRMLQIILDTIPVGIFWKDLDSNYLGCNRTFAADSGADSPEAVVGKSDFDLVWKDQAEQFRLDDRLVMEAGKPKLGYEEHPSTPSGGKIWVQTNKVPLRDAGGIIQGVLGAYEDITTRKQAEDALRESQKQLANIINFLPDATLVIDREGKVISWNRAMEEMTGVTADEMLGKGGYEYALPFHV